MNFELLDFAQQLITKCMPVHVERLHQLNQYKSEYNETSDFYNITQYHIRNSLHQYFQQCETSTIHNITTPLQTHYLVLCLSKEKDEHLMIGPFLEEPIRDHFIYPIINNLHLTVDHTMKLKLYYQMIPTLDLTVLYELMSTLNQFVTKKDVPPNIMMLDFSVLPKENSSYQLFLQDMNRSAMYKLLEDRYAAEDKLLSFISKGDVALAQLHWNKHYKRSIFDYIQIRSTDTLRNAKNLLLITNTLFRKAAHVGGVHPVYLDELSGKWAIKIEHASSFEGLDSMPLEMIRSYCLLTKNHSLSQYSPVIQQAINFINLNLSSHLSVKKLAYEVGLSPDHLTRLFKKELNTTVIAYINHKRIHTSLKLLNTTNLSIEEIGDLVGLSNTSYFYTLFKKQIGISPNQYRVSLK